MKLSLSTPSCACNFLVVLGYVCRATNFIHWKVLFNVVCFGYIFHSFKDFYSTSSR